VMHIS